MLQYQLKSRAKLSYIFGQLEKAKSLLNIEDYSVSQTHWTRCYQLCKDQTDLLDDELPSQPSKKNPVVSRKTMTALLAQVSEGPPWNFYKHAKIQGDSLIPKLRLPGRREPHRKYRRLIRPGSARSSVRSATLWPMYRSSRPVKCSTEMSHTVGEVPETDYIRILDIIFSVHRLNLEILTVIVK
uniref:ABCA1-4-like C-terminal R2 regulatory domain-containing protein n=1 Tax=Magallana gigas TaxID=29159 RepID=A0A8W8NG71_MAGGI